MSRASRRRSAERHARRSFWLLLAVSVLAAGALSSAVSAEPGAVTGLRVAVSGLLLAVTLGLASRVMVALERSRRHTRRRPVGGGS